MRKDLIEPEWPDEHKCGQCGSAVYCVESVDGETVELDADELETERVADLFGETYLRRSDYRCPEIRGVGGHQLLDPGLFIMEDGSSRWLWFSRRMSLRQSGSTSEPAPLHSEHFYSCKAVSIHAVLAKLTNTAYIGTAAGATEGKANSARDRAARSRSLGLGARREHDEAQSTDADDRHQSDDDESPPQPATDSRPTPPTEDCGQQIAWSF